MFCEECGANIPDGTEYCPNCGTHIAQNTRKSGPDFKKVGIVIGTAVIAVLVVVGVIFLVRGITSGKGNKTNSNTSFAAAESGQNSEVTVRPSTSNSVQQRLEEKQQAQFAAPSDTQQPANTQQSSGEQQNSVSFTQPQNTQGGTTQNTGNSQSSHGSQTTGSSVQAPVSQQPSSRPASLSTTERPTMQEFNWWPVEERGVDLTGYTKFTDFEQMKGSWKCLIVNDPLHQRDEFSKNLANIEIKGTADYAQIVLDWYQFYLDGDIYDQSGESDSTFSGNYQTEELYTVGPGNIRMYAFYSDGMNEKGFGMMTYQDGVEADVILMRP